MANTSQGRQKRGRYRPRSTTPSYGPSMQDSFDGIKAGWEEYTVGPYAGWTFRIEKEEGVSQQQQRTITAININGPQPAVEITINPHTKTVEMMQGAYDFAGRQRGDFQQALARLYWDLVYYHRDPLRPHILESFLIPSPHWATQSDSLVG